MVRLTCALLPLQVCHSVECGVLREQGVRPGGVVRGVRHWLYPALGVLRLLLLKRTDQAAWRRVEGLMDHWQEWQQDLQVHIVYSTVDYIFHRW